MYNPNNTKKLVIVNIARAMQDYCSIQPDIDETKMQAAELVAQNIDLVRLIGRENVERCIDPINLEDPPTEADIALRELVIIALCYYTYSRLLKMFPGTMTDSGYVVEEGAASKAILGNTAAEYYTVAETFMKDVMEYLKLEAPATQSVKDENLTPNIRVFGGREHRASN